jgi:hypothetical protein
LAKLNGGFDNLSPLKIFTQITGAPSLCQEFSSFDPVTLLEKSGTWPMIVGRGMDLYAI